MHITVFGANGKVGRQVVATLLNEGHVVRAFVHGLHSLGEHKNLLVISGDVHDRMAVSNAIKGSEAVISTLGSWGTKSKDILSTGIGHIISAMEQQGVKRIISLTGAAATYSGDTSFSFISKINRLALLVFARPILADSEKHLDLLHKSSLDWTVLRSPIMRKGSETHSYVLTNSNPFPWERVARESVVQSIVDQLTRTSWHMQAPFVRSA